MKTAFSIWQKRIAPVFDTARQIRLVVSSGPQVKAETFAEMPDDDGPEKVSWLVSQKVDTLVCGAISRLLQERLTLQGIKVFPFVAGNLEQVMGAYFEGKLSERDFAMPGCCGRRRMRCGCGHGRMGRRRADS